LVELFITNNMSKLYVIIIGVLIISCGQKDESTVSYQKIRGEAQGTTYSIVFDSSGTESVDKHMIDSIFSRIDSSLSVWKKESIISFFNASDSIIISDPHFLTVYYRSVELNELTNGAFNSQIAPLVKAWGFGKEGVKPKARFNPDSLLYLVQTKIIASVDSMNQAIAFAKLAGQSIDVNGIAQGYTVDVLSEFLADRGSRNFMVEVGGEVVARGMNESGDEWRIGIDRPIEDLSQRKLEAIAEISDRALATSGSYRKFYEMEGKKYSHTIDPKTGYPVEHNLLSVSVLASNCTNADAFATAFMVMGKDKTLHFIKEHPELNLDVYLIYSLEDGSMETYHTQGFALISKDEV